MNPPVVTTSREGWVTITNDVSSGIADKGPFAMDTSVNKTILRAQLLYNLYKITFEMMVPL